VPLGERIAHLPLLAGLGLLFLVVIAVPPNAAAAVTPSLSVQPDSGAVGSVVHVIISPPSAAAECGHIVFEPTGPADQLNAGNVDAGRIVVPSFVGFDLSTPVHAGRYQFAVSCSSGQLATPFTNLTTSFTVTAVLPSNRFVGMAPTPDGGGYWMAQAGGGVYSFGDAHFYGSLPGLHIVPSSPIVSIAAAPDGGGYWLVGADGGVFTFGDAHFYGSLPAMHINPFSPIVGIGITHDGGGYWLLGADGGVFTFGDAPYCTVKVPTAAVAHPSGYIVGDGYSAVGVAADPGSVGYDEIDSGGGGFALPPAGEPCDPNSSQDFGYLSLPGNVPLDPTAQISGVAGAVNGQRVWLVGIDGGVFTPVDNTTQGTSAPSPFYGSLPDIGVTPVAPIVGMAATPDGGGYWMVGADGGVFAFGDAAFYGSAA
jgi:hypothetical protein